VGSRLPSVLSREKRKTEEKKKITGTVLDAGRVEEKKKNKISGRNKTQATYEKHSECCRIEKQPVAR
jgi:hypothetical protein